MPISYLQPCSLILRTEIWIHSLDSSQICICSVCVCDLKWLFYIKGSVVNRLTLGNIRSLDHFSCFSHWKNKSSRKTSTSALLTMPKPLIVWITINCGKFWKRWEYQTTWLAFWEICMQFRKQQLKPDMEQQTGSKLGKEYIKAICCHPAYSAYM